MMPVDSKFVGVDASRDSIEASVLPTGEFWRVGASEAGMTEIAGRLSCLQPELVVMQANGSAELPLAGILATAGLPFAFVQPRNVREFARAIGRLGRSAQGQAGLLAHFAELVRPDAWTLSEESIQQLKDLRLRRQEIHQMIANERERAVDAPAILMKDLQQHIQYLERAVISLDLQFARTIRVSRIWH
jgi:transposase